MIEMKNYDLPIGFMKVSTDQSHLLDFALLEEYWHRDILIEAFQLLHPYPIEQDISELYLKVESTHTDSCDFCQTDLIFIRVTL